MHLKTALHLLHRIFLCLLIQLCALIINAQTLSQVATGFHNPTGVFVSGDGTIYVADCGNHLIKKIDASGNVIIIAGTGNPGYSGDGGPAISAELNYPYRLCLDLSSNIYFSDEQNNVVRKIDTAGIISTVAGTGRAGYAGDDGPAIEAQLNNPMGVCCDATGNLFIADGFNHRIRKVDASGIITTIAGSGSIGANNGTHSGDGGPATESTLNLPNGIAIDGAGNLYIAEEYNSVIRKINNVGMISTVAGQASVVPGYSGDGGQATNAKLNAPLSLSVDVEGNIVFVDESNFVIRKISNAGVISTIAGNGTQGHTVNTNITASQASLGNPNGIYVTNNGIIFFTDNSQNVLYKITN